MTRREEREHIFKLLFLTEFYKEEELEQQEMMYYEGRPYLYQKKI